MTTRRILPTRSRRTCTSLVVFDEVERFMAQRPVSRNTWQYQTMVKASRGEDANELHARHSSLRGCRGAQAPVMGEHTWHSLLKACLALSTIVQLGIFTNGIHVATMASVTTCVLRSMELLTLLFGFGHWARFMLLSVDNYDG